MTYMLRGATEENGGTARSLSKELLIDNEIGAKTGTTQNGSDGWFMGLTKDLVAGVWVGGEDRAIHFKSVNLGQGGKMAMPIWDKFMMKVYADSTSGYVKGYFQRPNKPLSIEIDCQIYEDKSLNSLDNKNSHPTY
jgi:penicillin-binding protein 1A